MPQDVGYGVPFWVQWQDSPVVGSSVFDGVNQAQCRVPCALTKTHAFVKLIRPALHVKGLGVKGLPIILLWQMLA